MSLSSSASPSVPSTLLGDLSPEAFLEDYWQKQPLLIRDALPDFRSPLEPEELAGLALEPDVESRLILEKGGDEPWELREGPFAQEDFLELPETHWTLLVQEVDRLVPAVGDLLEPFQFLPDWRIDDVMISFAPEGGNVGPHIDNYDVFLLQGLGHRRWQIGSEPIEDEDIVEDVDVRILDDFEPDAEYVLGPGDMLYLPPRVAHHGVATDDCMTYSIGFLAPSHRELVADFLQYALEHVDPEARYSDPDLAPADHPGELTDDALQRVRSLLRETVADDTMIDRWFGQYVTEPQRNRIAVPRDEPVSEEDLADALRSGTDLRRSPASRIAYRSHSDGTATLFVNGDARDLPSDLANLAPVLAGRERIPSADLQPYLDGAALSLLAELVNDGFLELDAG